MQQFKINKTVTVIILLLILSQAVPLIIWTEENNAPPAWDQSWHSMISVDVYNRLFHKDVYNATQSEKSYPILAFAKNYYPPFFHSTTIIPYLLLGVEYNTAILTNILYIIIMVISCYFIGKKIDKSSTGLLIAFIISILPIYSALSREYLIDYALAALVAIGYCLWLYSEHFKNRVYAIAFGVVFGFGMLTKWTYAIFLIVPIMMSIVHISIVVIKMKKLQRVVNAGIALVCAVLLAATWYTPSKIQSLFSQISVFSNIYSGAVPLWSRSTEYIYTMINGFIPILFLLFMGALCFLLWNGFKDKNHLQPLLTPFLTIIVIYIVFSSISNHDTRYIAPIYIFLAVITAVGMMRLKEHIPKKTGYVLLGIFLIGGVAYIFAYQSSRINMIYEPLGIPIMNTIGKYPDIHPRILGSDIIDALRIMNESRNKESFSVCIVAESQYLNDVNIPYYAMRERYPVSLMFGNGCNPRAFDFIIVGEIQETWRSQAFKSSKQELEENARSFQGIYHTSQMIIYKNRVHR